ILALIERSRARRSGRSQPAAAAGLRRAAEPSTTADGAGAARNGPHHLWNSRGHVLAAAAMACHRGSCRAGHEDAASAWPACKFARWRDCAALDIQPALPTTQEVIRPIALG